MRTYENILMAATGYDYATGCLLHYPFFKKYCMTIDIDLSKQQAVDVVQKQFSQQFY